MHCTTNRKRPALQMRERQRFTVAAAQLVSEALAPRVILQLIGRTERVVAVTRSESGATTDLGRIKHPMLEFPRRIARKKGLAKHRRLPRFPESEAAEDTEEAGGGGLAGSSGRQFGCQAIGR